MEYLKSFMLSLKCDHPLSCEFPILFSTVKVIEILFNWNTRHIEDNLVFTKASSNSLRKICQRRKPTYSDSWKMKFLFNIILITLLKRNSNTGVFLWILRIFKNTYFEEHCDQLVLQICLCKPSVVIILWL